VWRKVNAKDITTAETKLKFKFPPSYKLLVTTHGAAGLGKNAKGSYEQLSYAVLTPKEVVMLTKELRGTLDADMFEEPSSLARVTKQLANAVFFQIGQDAGEGFVFLLDTKDKNGEMSIADYAHDDLEELMWEPSSTVVWRSPSKAMFQATSRIAAELLD